MIADNQAFEGLDAVRRILLLLPVTYFTFIALVGIGLTPSLDTTRFADAVIALVPLFFVPVLRRGRPSPAPSNEL